jgi:phosphoglycolate phosphatase-like HAD superfamily hydrolase
VVTGSDADESKPAPDLIHAVLARLDTDPARCIMIGDTPYDGQAATSAGVPFVGLRCGGCSTEMLMAAGARAVRDDPADVLLHLDDTLQATVSAH